MPDQTEAEEANAALGWLNDSDSSEAHAICDCISGVLDEEPEKEHKKITRSMLVEFQNWATAAIKRLDGG